MAAERDTTDRYLAAYLSERVGSEFTGRISGVARFGAFVKLDETGADGLVPMRNLGREYFIYDRASDSLMGADTGTIIKPGQRVTVRLEEAAPVTGGLALELLELEDAALPGARPQRGKGKGRPAGRKPAQAKRKAAALQDKAERRRKGAKSARKVERKRR
jgi:ribonuclease R